MIFFDFRCSMRKCGLAERLRVCHEILKFKFVRINLDEENVRRVVEEKGFLLVKAEVKS